MARKKAVTVPPKLTEAEQDLISHMVQEYPLDRFASAGPSVAPIKDDEVMRPQSAHHHTVEALDRTSHLLSSLVFS